MIESRIISNNDPWTLRCFPFDVIKMKGDESVDFLQRITSNDFSLFSDGAIQRTLLVSDKGKIIDTVWVIHRYDFLLMIVSTGMASEIISWLEKYIVMEEITLKDVTHEYQIDVHSGIHKSMYQSKYFHHEVSFDVLPASLAIVESQSNSFEQWRIDNGIPSSKKEMVQEFNPLELNLWDWISFTKGCYIGQEVIARLDTYNKIQRTLCKISSYEKITEHNVILDDKFGEVGKVTSVIAAGDQYNGLAVIRKTSVSLEKQFTIKNSTAVIRIEKIFNKENNGRN